MNGRDTAIVAAAIFILLPTVGYIVLIPPADDAAPTKEQPHGLLAADPQFPVFDRLLYVAPPGQYPEPSTWWECADAALERAMDKAHVSTNTKAVLKLNYDLAVCDRTFPEAATP